MASSTGTYVGIDVGGTRVKWAVLREGSLADRGDEATAREGGEALMDQIANLTKTLAPDATAVGVAMPGTVDTANRQTLVIPNIAGNWGGYPAGQAIESRCGVAVHLINDARAFAFAELYAGAARGHREVLFLTVGTGIGGAFARAGDIVIGDVDWIGEIGHAAVQRDGELCGCGARGCLETVASASAVVARSVRAVLTGQSQTLTDLSGGRVEDLTAEMVAVAADDGDPWALAAFEGAGVYLGMAAATCCVFLHTNTVIIGGGLAGAFRHLAPAIHRVVDERARITGPVQVMPAQLGSYAGSVGAAISAAYRSGTDINSFPPKVKVEREQS